MMSRAVAGHAASIGIAGALSFVFAETIASHLGWQGAFAAAAACALAAWTIVMIAVPRQSPGAVSDVGTFDFAPVIRNRPAMAYAVAYGALIWLDSSSLFSPSTVPLSMGILK